MRLMLIFSLSVHSCIIYPLMATQLPLSPAPMSPTALSPYMVSITHCVIQIIQVEMDYTG